MNEPGAAAATLADGVSLLAGTIARTLGPSAGSVLHLRGRGLPEVLDDSATVARRITGQSGDREHAGVMILRSMCESMHLRYGDGAATATVLAQALSTRAARLVVGGAEAVAVRRGIERGVSAATRALADSAVAINGANDLARLATGAARDPEIGKVLGEMFDILGEQAGLIIEERTLPGIDRSYVDGARWRARPAYKGVLPEGTTELTVRDPLVVVVDAVLREVEHVLPAMELAIGSPLMLVSRGIEGVARQLVERNRAVVIPVCLGSAASSTSDDLEDFALSTGATLLSDVVGRTVDRAACGHARQAVLRKNRLTISDGGGDAEQIRQRVSEVSAHTAGLERGKDEWRKARLRIARLAGSVGVIVVGGYTESERQQQIERVTKAQRVLEMALVDGVVPGGGVAYLQCIPAVIAAGKDCSADERWGVEAVATALEAPFRQIVHNSGGASANALERVRELGDGWGFEAREETYVSMTKAGVLDSAGVARGALQAAGSVASTIVSTAEIVRGRKAAA